VVKILKQWKGTGGACLKIAPESESGNLFAKGRSVVVDLERE